MEKYEGARGAETEARFPVRLSFFMAMRPPTVTAQEKQVRVVNGKPVFYEPRRLKDARAALVACLAPRAPKTPLTGAVSLSVMWLFPKGRHEHGEWRITKPDTDNLEKLLKDCMTAVGFWQDDAQVAVERVEKRWSDEPSGIYIEVEELPNRRKGH